MQNNEKYLFIVSGPAGVGKDSVVREMRNQHPEIERSVTATTRAPRPGEEEGVNYYYYTEEAFQKLQAEGGVLESNYFCGNYYGTVRHDVDARLQKQHAVVLVIDVNGAASIKKIYPGATTIFINPPSPEELESRLRGRATESEEKILERLAKAKGELDAGTTYDEKMVNDTLASAAQVLYQIILKHIS